MEEKGNIILGSYPQNDELLKKEPLEWIVLKQEGNRILCISKFLIDCKPYNDMLENVTWENCTLRKWLNNDFFVTAFSKEEQSRILMTTVKTPLHETNDHIFLLSYNMAEDYFDFDERAAKTTEYARKQGAWFLDDPKERYANNGSWWLLYPEDEEGLYDTLSCVNFDGYIESYADEVTAQTCCVRPVFWLDAEK